MDNKIALFLSLITIVLFTSCDHDVDFSGFIRSTDRVEKRFEQSIQWNMNHPFQTITTDIDEYSILVAADSHIGGMDNFSSLKQVYINNNFLSLVLVGDIVSGREEDYLIYQDSIAEITKPIFPVVGNHDLYFDGWKNFYKIMGSSTYYFIIETPIAKDIYICLDNGCGTYGESQIKWLKDLLKSSRDEYRYCTIFSHVNILRTRRTTSASPMTEEVVFLLDLFNRYKINYIINGHDHLQNEETFGDTKYIIVDAILDNYDCAGYTILNVNKSNITHEFVRL